MVAITSKQEPVRIPMGLWVEHDWSVACLLLVALGRRTFHNVMCGGSTSKLLLIWPVLAFYHMEQRGPTSMPPLPVSDG